MDGHVAESLDGFEYDGLWLLFYWMSEESDGELAFTLGCDEITDREKLSKVRDEITDGEWGLGVSTLIIPLHDIFGLIALRMKPFLDEAES